MKGEEYRAGIKQVEGNFRQQRKNQQSQAIAPVIRSMPIALAELKGENGERQPSQAGHPQISPHHRGPQVVQEHEQDGKQAQHPRVNTKASVVFASLFHVTPLFLID